MGAKTPNPAPVGEPKPLASPAPPPPRHRIDLSPGLAARAEDEGRKILSRANLASPQGSYSRRLKLYRVSPQALIALGQREDVIFCTRATMPLDARVVSVAYLDFHDVFAVKVESEEFDPVLEGQLIPWADEPWFRIARLKDADPCPA